MSSGSSSASESSTVPKGSPSSSSADKQNEKARVSRTSLILWHSHRNEVAAVRKLLKEDQSLVQGQNGSHFEPKPVLPLLPNKCDCEIDPSEPDF
ncbi:hypothetical protein Dsin_028507 [Dipteronia sinensis]|uniref:Uncharacterized protein n=1 Tax=Dipteronia sinensis TaxID=43782 RepID=A0AAD9ZSC1_9ROSI|nr:hypothetical protein Dsin_028507 [Dipteronia sinensis]